MVHAENNYPDNHKLYTEKGVSGSLPLHFFLERYQESYVHEMQEFVTALISDLPMPVGGEDGRLSIAIGLAAGISYAENRAVKISEIIDKSIFRPGVQAEEDR